MHVELRSPEKPKYRGVSHQIAFWASLALGTWLIADAHGDRARIALSIYSVCLASMFGVSAALHRCNWSPVALQRMRRLDRSTIFAAVAGTYTPIAILALHGLAQAATLYLSWLAVAVGIVLQWSWLRSPKWLAGVVYVTLGWAAVLILPELARSSGAGALGLLVAGGVLYTIGALVLAMRKPDPKPAIFGYHEVFHIFVIVAALCQWLAIAFYL